uniref:Platelet endothelial aggregation receptor 1-like n=1 Tax=Phallusia mammillata TaxID=59560 RepID=A0A6F9DNQ5_9ASCI|nr:platelet endothelial aggregation receptor 1-like [Phallusia mammillata]
MTLTIQNVTSSLNNTVVVVMGDGASANSTLTVLAGCGPPPTGSGCETYNCASNSSTYIGSMMGSVNTYNCYNTTTCGADGLWTALTTKCGTTAVGCQETNTWGASCNMTCGVGCLVARKCSFVNGSCLDAAGAITTACKPGYTGNTCSSMSVNCTYGKWGMNCNKTCGAGCRYSCDRTSGQCLNQQGSAAEAFCMPGYKGPKCDQVGCQIAGVYGPQCDLICGKGCPFTVCDFTTGACLDNSTTPVVTTQCITGYEGTRCETPICPGGCNGGVCFFPNYCGNCPNHFAQLGDFSTGVTCRNIRLDGFLKGSLPTFAILTVIVILLTVSSKWYIRRKLKLT